MKYTLKVASLEHIALLKIATTLWSSNDVLALMAKFKYLPIGYDEEWQKIENKVSEIVLQLSQPKAFEKKILSLIKPIGLEILKWMECHCNTSYICIKLPREFCWTSQGAIDKKKTAELLIKDESLSPTTRYRLACIYCLEDDIPKLWNKIPQSIKNFLFCTDHLDDGCEQELVVFWTYILKDQAEELVNVAEDRLGHSCSLYQFAFDSAAESGNKVATEFFFQKLTAKERSECLIKAVVFAARRKYYPYEGYANFHVHYCDEIVFFLLSQMQEEQEVKVFKTCPYDVLLCFLDWSLRNFFVETAHHVQTYLSKDDVLCVLKAIVNKIKFDYRHCNYQELFGEFWKQISDSHKRYILSNYLNDSLLYNLFQIEDEKNIKLVLKSANIEQKKKIAFTNKGHILCQFLIFSKKWHLLKMILQEVISSDDEMLEFKEDFKKHLSEVYSDLELENKNLWNKIIRQIDELVYDYN